MSTHRQFASSKKGLSPGTAIYVGKQPPEQSCYHVYVYDKNSCQYFDAYDEETVYKAIDEGRHIWIDICGLADISIILGILKGFQVHPLIIEDVFNTKQRPKLDVIEDYLYVVVKLLRPKLEDQFSMGSEQLSIIMKKNILISIRETESYEFSTLYKRLETETSLVREKGSDYLIYLMLDTIVDDYFHIVEATAEELQVIEKHLLEDSEQINIRQLYAFKRQTIIMRKTIAPIRDIIHLLIQESDNRTLKKFELYLLDLHDHCIRLLEDLDLQREIINSLLDLYLSIQNNRMNDTMKTLTIFASLFIPLTFIAGVYGMNFEYMPELKWLYSYPAVLLIMAVIAGAMLYHFKRKKLF